MKKSLIALAVLGAFSAGASAQSNVTLYGIIDIGVQYNTSGVNRGTTAAPNFQQEDVWQVNSGYQSGSRFGLRGSEALGGGLNAVFTLEGGYDADTGFSGQGTRLYGRQVWAGLQGGWGTLVAGRVATPSSGTGSFDQWGVVDPFGTGWGIGGLQATFIMSAAQRFDNSILYSSPTWGGFKLGAYYSFNTNLQESAPQGSNQTAAGIAGSIALGAFYGAVTYDVIGFADAGSARAAAGASSDQKMLQIGGTYDLKFVKLHAAYADQSNITPTGGVNIANPIPTTLIPTVLPGQIFQYDNSAWMAGVTVPLFGGSLLGSYQSSDADNINTATYQFEPDFDVWQVGFQYPLSRRTNIYIGYAQRSWDGTVAQTSSPALTQATQIFDLKQFALGVRHLF